VVNNQNEILNTLKNLKPHYEKEGIKFVGLFGSYATETQTKLSDIDIAYAVDYETFSANYRDGFAKLLRIETIKEELQAIFKTPIDLVPDTNRSILKDLINV